MGGSTDLMTYLNYIATWETESDGNIDKLLDEHRLFVRLGDFDSDTSINNEFNTLVSLAKQVRDWTVAADAVEMAADAAAVASFWSFGLGMAAFVALEAEAAIDKAVASSKAKELNEKMQTADTDIAKNITPDVGNYVTAYKANNNLIVSKAPKGMDTKECRTYLMQFMGEIEKKEKKIDAATFKKYAGSARIIFDSEEIQKVYDALDQLNLSNKSKEDIEKFMKVLADLKVVPDWTRTMVSLTQGISLSVALRNLNVQRKTITECAEAAGLPLEEVEASAFKMMDSGAKFALAVAVIMSVVDVVMDIMDIVHVVDQCDKMVDKLNGEIKTSYQDYFNNIKQSAKAYNEAIAGNGGTSKQYHLTLPQGSIKVRNNIFSGSTTIAQWSPYNPNTTENGWNDGDTLTVICTYNLTPDIDPLPPASEYVGLCVGACAASNPGGITSLENQARSIVTGSPQAVGMLLGSNISTEATPTDSDIFYSAKGAVMPTVTLEPSSRGQLVGYYYHWDMTYNGNNTVVQNGDDVEIVYGYGDPQSGETKT